MDEQMKKALEYLRHDLKMEEEAAELYACQAAEMEEGWLRKIFIDNVADERAHAEVFRYAIERVEYSVANPTVPTGIDELDNILYGGIPEGYAVLITSPPLDERYLLMERFLLEGIDRGEVALLLSTRLRGIQSELAVEKPESFYLVLCSPRSDLVIGDGPNIFKFHGVENLTHLNIALETLFRKIKEKGETLRRVVLDIVSDALLAHEIKVVRSWLKDLLTMFKSTNATVISTLDPGMHSSDVARIVNDVFDGHMDIHDREVEGERTRTMSVRRLYGKKYLKKELVLERDKLTQQRRS